MCLISWGNKVPKEFIAKLMTISDQLKWSPQHASWLMGCMAFESGETFSPSIRNMAGSGATGLIQFMPKTAISLGTDVDRLSKMTAVEQLNYVALYFQLFNKRFLTLSDMYMAILMPKYIGAKDDTPIFSSGIAYRQNSGLDANKDGVVTKAEASAKVQAKWEKGLRDGYALRI